MIRRMTEADKSEIRKAQLTRVELVKKLGFSPNAISQFAIKNNIQLPDKRFFRNHAPIEVGNAYGLLTVLERESRDGIIGYKCICECGNLTFKRTHWLLKTRTPNCGDPSHFKAIHLTKRKGYGEASAHIVFLNYIAGAKRRGLEFLLTEIEFRRICSMDCFYCGGPPSNSSKKGNSATPFIYNGIDRKNNNLPYTLGNCVPACKTCNYAKHILSIDEFVAWVSKVYANIPNWSQL